MPSRLMAFGTYDSAVHPRFGVLLEGLRASGHDVVEVNLPLGLDTAARVRMLRKPWRLPALVVRLLGRWIRLGVRGRRAYRQTRPTAVLVGYLGHFDVVLARLLFPRARIVLDHLLFASDTARDRGSAGRLLHLALRGLDRLALHCADVIVLDTEEHAAMVPTALQSRALVCPVGAPDTWFDAAPREAAAGDTASPLRVAFFGLFTPLQGATTIAAAARLLATRSDVVWTMIGRGQDLDAAREHAGAEAKVDWIEWVSPADLPALVAAHDVCLGIFGKGPKALRVVPNKVFQGAAVGRAVVTSDTPPQRRLLGSDAAYVPPGDAEALAAAIGRLAANRAETAGLGAGIRARALREFTPQAVAAPLDAVLDDSTGEHGSRP